MEENQEKYINQLICEIETKLNWGKGVNWRQRDFETLIDLIYEQSKVQLSLSTLKRIWKGNFKQIPQKQTLNALVVFLGYNNWQDYISTKNEGESDKKPNKNSKKKKYFIKLVVIMIPFLGFFFYKMLITSVSTADEMTEFPHVNNLRFEIEPVTNGLPNSVIFNYHVPNIGIDSIFIQQSWDKNRRERVSSDDSIHTSIYYYPGYYQTKLIINDSIMVEKPLHILTKDWVGMITEKEYQPIPIYIPSSSLRENGFMTISPKALQENNIESTGNQQWIHFLFSNDFKHVTSNDLVFETAIKNARSEGALDCQTVYIQLHFETGFAKIPLTIKGCISDISLLYNDYFESGKKSNMNNFGVNMDEWQKIKITSKENKTIISLNDEKVKTVVFTKESGKLKYIHYIFKGYGKVDYVRLSDTNGKIIYSENF